MVKLIVRELTTRVRHHGSPHVKKPQTASCKIKGLQASWQLRFLASASVCARDEVSAAVPDSFLDHEGLKIDSDSNPVSLFKRYWRRG
jgi:hypothetical protein